MICECDMQELLSHISWEIKQAYPLVSQIMFPNAHTSRIILSGMSKSFRAP